MKLLVGAVGTGIGVVAIAVAACSDGEQADIGIGEPIQVSGAQFISGTLPGSPPPAANAGAAGDGGVPALQPLSVTSLTFQNSYLISGVSGSAITGLATATRRPSPFNSRTRARATGFFPCRGRTFNFRVKATSVSR